MVGFLYKTKNILGNVRKGFDNELHMHSLCTLKKTIREKGFRKDGMTGF